MPVEDYVDFKAETCNSGPFINSKEIEIRRRYT